MKKKVPVEDFFELLRCFEKEIEPWCRENHLTLHQAFEVSREQDKEKYRVLSDLWRTPSGRSYLRGVFSGGNIRKSTKKSGNKI